ncbi:MAG: ribosome small subunit-dependent GTPase A [Deltaproteobacteria bacterium]|nr:ribosome small subunit-dependent GTPase A [Deltaproteobacteria bacterium]
MLGGPVLGWDAGWEAARRAVDPEGVLAAVRIAAEHRGAYHAIGDGGTAWVEVTGKAFHAAGDKRELPTVGDWVLVESWARAIAGGGAATVREMLPRRTFLVRRAAGEAVVPQPLAANVDIGIVMTSANADLSPARLDRYVGLLRDGGIEPVIAISKIDLAPEGRAALVEGARAVAPHVVCLSVVTGDGMPEVRALGGEGRTCVLLGSSGVGKSSLLNALVGSTQEIGAIRADERGRHTTTHRELFVAPDGGLWIDTPGMRELAQWIDEGEEAAFDDITAAAEHCKFRDCRHREEPGCGVRGKVPAGRLASFHKLADERIASAARQETAQKLAETRRVGRQRKRARRKPDPA